MNTTMLSNMMTIHKNSTVLFLGLALISVVINGCGSKPETESQSKPNEKGPVSLQVISPVKYQPEYTLALPGELKPYEQVSLFAKVRGFVKAIKVDRGSVVRKGQVLAILDAPEVSQRFQSARSDQQKFYEDFQLSRQMYERILKATQKDGSVAAIELDRAKSKLRSDSAAYRSAISSAQSFGQIEEYLKIIAPFDGVVVERNVSVGALVGENNTTPLLVIAQNRKLRLTVAIPEKHAQSVGKNAMASFTVSNLPGKMFTSVLSRKSQVLQQQNRSVTAEFDVENKDNSLDGGEYAQVTMKLRRPDSTLWVPASSIVHAQSGTFVLRVENQTVIKVPVSEGTRRDSIQEVFGELDRKDQIVKIGSEELLNAGKIIIK
ncbi:efflux RND transporter periplasmic adaptor subunit [Dyadobacter psychrotolerans]|uniref:Efflux RND transporter periplasmic adaptor subunit n=1 Tax=Dyadobacter psychrotolerans TaxID=2541721 RepID=A0A4V2Z2K4_9BACT|nr:efflux RND transporter periplasmic adaptor subunit [Dyadobacter psychrotolerans]TDE09188.1 efflux RND transporter periplasmic adaptor subunit [Dyadobacter psychrotolerans]